MARLVAEGSPQAHRFRRLFPDGMRHCDGQSLPRRVLPNYTLRNRHRIGQLGLIRPTSCGASLFRHSHGDLFVPNSDSVGLFPGLNDTEAMFCLNYCITPTPWWKLPGA